jgi:hypothetical protein
MRDDTAHCILHKKWVERLIKDARFDLADASTLYYLEYLQTCNQAELKTQNTIYFWAAVMQENRAVLSKSLEFFRKAFPEVDLENLTLPRYIRMPSSKTPSKMM